MLLSWLWSSLSHYLVTGKNRRAFGLVYEHVEEHLKMDGRAEATKFVHAYSLSWHVTAPEHLAWRNADTAHRLLSRRSRILGLGLSPTVTTKSSSSMAWLARQNGQWRCLQTWHHRRSRFSVSYCFFKREVHCWSWEGGNGLERGGELSLILKNPLVD